MPIVGKRKEGYIKFFGHLQFRPMDNQVIKCYCIQMIGVKKGRGKPKTI